MAPQHSTVPLVVVVLLAVIASASKPAGGQGFLGASHRHGAGPHSSEADFRAAMGVVMGCGGDAGDRLAAVEHALEPMWRVLPKNQHGRVEWGMVRYLAHRYFMQRSSLLVRGFEPMRQVAASELGAADILQEKVPSVVEGVLEGRRSSRGFSLEDVAALVATLEQLTWDAEGTLLEAVYAQQRKSTKALLGHGELSWLLEAYMVHWILEADQGTVGILLQNRSLLESVFPKWPEIKGYLDGILRSMEFAHRRAPSPGRSRIALSGGFSFGDAHEAVGQITRTFASFWEGECQLIKESLVALDRTGTGRVSLSDFYGANSDGDLRFGESEAYLRELGALDESSAWRGKQVIIPNYMQGASNCIAMTQHYLVCCANECEAVLNEVEDAVGGPVARPEEILPVVGNMSGFDDAAPKVDAALRSQLQRIADTHGGSVPLHARLFAQWLHYVFPRECPFPHRAGVASALTPSQFGGGFMASEEDVSRHAAGRGENASLIADHDEAQWMAQWSEDEELIVDYSLVLSAPWQGQRRVATIGAVLVGLALVVAAATSGGGGQHATTLHAFGSSSGQKSHLV
eukprot:CAMPEP_0117562680 /NCGR_PEP_ID=MMETSP0784-20121206/55085_1 /TAXON_ID=39447 /ORGANISM="" /LENGTH=573 /DNA_ID=CAMNT_0005360265 /DNA_START=31 /DNA_END=1752 /DNA_ORIENTATION=+